MKKTQIEKTETIEGMTKSKSNFIKAFSKPVLKLSKGLLLIFTIKILFFGSLLLIQSCKKADFVIKDNASENFLTALNKQMKTIASLSVKNVNKSNYNIVSNNMKGSNSIRTNSEDEQTFFINFDNMSITPNYSYDINGMASLISNYHGVLSYVPINNSYSFLIPLEDVNNTLLPLISEAKIYLNARGLTNQDIIDMLLEEGGQEADLVTFATLLSKYEQTGTTAMNFSNLFGTASYASPSPLHCAAVALGVDIIWSLSSSTATTWTKGALKKAFGTVAKRLLGPVGVAITLITFGLCMGDWLP